MVSYATTEDVIAFRGPQEARDLEALSEVLVACSAALRQYAKQVGIDLDKTVAEDEDIDLLARKAVVDASCNYCASVKSNEPLMSQFSQSAGGYSISGTLANVGGGFYFPKSILRQMGIIRPKATTLEVWKW